MDGEEAIQLLRETGAEMALVDIQMPKVSGFDFIKLIRNDPALAPTKCLALTAYAMGGDREKVLAAGFDAYLSKPFESRELIEAIQNLL